LKTLGRHLLVELYGCDAKAITDVRRVEEIMVGAAKHAKATIVDVVFHSFNPHGISGVIVIQESHLTIHTWPEYNFASVDVYTCGNKVNPWTAYKYLAKHFRAKNVTALEMKRGVLNLASSGAARHYAVL
jgi:S-adenosylmethionine decarboxylase proenzyme